MQMPQVRMLEPMSDMPQPSVLLDGLPVRQMIFEIIFGHGIFASEKFIPSPYRRKRLFGYKEYFNQYTTDEIRT